MCYIEKKFYCDEFNTSFSTFHVKSNQKIIARRLADKHFLTDNFLWN